MIEKLPDKLSDLITLALKDETKAYRSSKYEIDMNTWHEPTNNRCKVCFAGSVIAFSLKGNINQTLVPLCFNSHTYNRLAALNYIRCGLIGKAIKMMGELHPNGLPEQIEPCSYSVDRLKWRKDMFKIVKMLIKFNL